MSTVTSTPKSMPGPQVVSRRDRSRSRARSQPWLLSTIAAVVAFSVRAMGLGRSNDLFIDELTYTRLAVAVSRGQLPNLAGQPFLLHPPGGLLLNGLVIKVAGLSGGTMDLVYDLRWVNAVLGAAMVALAFLILFRLTTPGIATIAAAVLAFDPFVLRNDSRVMLETPATVALLAGWLILVVALTRAEPRLSTPVAATAGGLLGLALFTKDMTIIPALLPLVLAVFWRRTLPRRSVCTVAAAAVVPYLIYLVVVATHGLLGQWWSAKSFGAERMIGARQISGFNAPGAPSLWQRLLEQATSFGTSYILIVACVVAGVFAALSGQPARRLIGLIAISTGLLGLYAAAAGALEEQFGYYVVVTSVLALAVTGAELIERRPSSRRVATMAAVVFLVLTVLLGSIARLTTDNGYVQARAWMDTHLPATANVGLTAVTAEFALLPHSYYGVWPSLASLNAHHADYVLTQSRQLSDGYGYAAPQLLTWLQHNAIAVFVVDGPSAGQTTVWKLNQAALSQAVSDGNTIPPISGNYP